MLRFIFLLLPAIGFCASVSVCDSGCDHTTIVAAIAAITGGQANTITVTGTYTANEDSIVIDKSGADTNNRLVIQATDSQTVKRFDVAANYVTIQGFTVTGHTTSNNSLIRIRTTVQDVKILNCAIRDAAPTVYGIVTTRGGTQPSQSASNVTIQDCLLDFTNGGDYPNHMIELWGTNHTIRGNTFANNRGADAIRIHGSGHTISLNLFNGISQIAGNTNHADIIQTFGDNDDECFNILFEQNFINGGAELQLGQATQDNGDPGTLTADPADDTTGVLTDASKAWSADGYARRIVTIKSGSAAGEIYLVTSNTGTTLTVTDLDGGVVNPYADGVRSGDAYAVNLHSGWFTFRNNVYANTGATDGGNFNNTVPYMTWENNTFYYDGPGVGNQGHVLNFSTFAVNGRADHATVKNNVFLECGYNPASTTLGWYQQNVQDGVAPISFTADYNYVAGTDYAAKTGFSEASGINGGNPNLANVANVLGPDGLPFTADDGLRPLVPSPLCAGGEGGTYIGAYACGYPYSIRFTGGNYTGGRQ